jgi:hypothetical protein
MKSNVCKIEKGTKYLNSILAESERVAKYNGFNHKQTLQLRLLCEELDGMLPNIIEGFKGEFWIEFEDGVCKVNVSISIPELTTDKKNKLIDIAKNKKNAAVVGIIGKIRNSIENFFLDEERMDSLAFSAGSFGVANSYGEGVDYAYLWRLEEYRSTVKKETREDDWDELEKSVIASVADDVIVGVKGTCAEIVIIKKFA